MSPALGEILGRAGEGTKFRFKRLPQAEFTVLGLDIETVDGEEELIGYHLQERSPRVTHPHYGKVYQGAGEDYSRDEIEIIERK